jgi:A/G-specific adenine glycosylase
VLSRFCDSKAILCHPQLAIVSGKGIFENKILRDHKIMKTKKSTKDSLTSPCIAGNDIIRLDDPFHAFLLEHEQSLKEGAITPLLFEEFQSAVWVFYKKNRRDFAWRNTRNPYHIVVSEIMLQQTQTARVAEKYENFLEKFASFDALASASVVEVLTEWVGLGYNRRALALQGIAQKIVAEYNGILPSDSLILETFKGLGPATAASIVAFAYNKPTIFIETNIRAVYLHAFFGHQQELVADKQLLPLVNATVDQENAREWYYALMDCGVALKKLYKNPSRKSKHHAKQSKFEGSDRQIRGAVVRILTQKKEASFEELQLLGYEEIRLTKILDDLCKEGFILRLSGRYKINCL